MSSFNQAFGEFQGNPPLVPLQAKKAPLSLQEEEFLKQQSLINLAGQRTGEAAKVVGGIVGPAIGDATQAFQDVGSGVVDFGQGIVQGLFPPEQTAPVGQPPTDGSTAPTEEVGPSTEIVAEKDAKKIIKAKTGQTPDEAIGTLHGAAEEAVGFDIKEGEITSETMKAAQELIADINTQQSILSQKLNRSGLAELNRNDQITTAVALLAGGLGEAFIGGGSGAGLAAGANIAAGAQGRIEGRNAAQDQLDMDVSNQLVSLGKTQVEAAQIIDALKAPKGGSVIPGTLITNQAAYDSLRPEDVTKLREDEVAMSGLTQDAFRLNSLLDRHGTSIGDDGMLQALVSNPLTSDEEAEVAAEMQALANSLLVVYNAKVAGLGALAGEDKTILNGIISDPTGFTAKLQSNASQLARLKFMINKVKTTRNKKLNVSGLGLNREQAGERINESGKVEKLYYDADGSPEIDTEE